VASQVIGSERSKAVNTADLRSTAALCKREAILCPQAS
jgi:hypothetical protein